MFLLSTPGCLSERSQNQHRHIYLRRSQLTLSSVSIFAPEREYYLVFSAQDNTRDLTVWKQPLRYGMEYLPWAFIKNGGLLCDFYSLNTSNQSLLSSDSRATSCQESLSRDISRVDRGDMTQTTFLLNMCTKRLLNPINVLLHMSKSISRIMYSSRKSRLSIKVFILF